MTSQVTTDVVVSETDLHHISRAPASLHESLYSSEVWSKRLRLSCPASTVWRWTAQCDEENEGASSACCLLNPLDHIMLNEKVNVLCCCSDGLFKRTSWQTFSLPTRLVCCSNTSLLVKSATVWLNAALQLGATMKRCHCLVLLYSRGLRWLSDQWCILQVPAQVTSGFPNLVHLFIQQVATV